MAKNGTFHTEEQIILTARGSNMTPMLQPLNSPSGASGRKTVYERLWMPSGESSLRFVSAFA